MNALEELLSEFINYLLSCESLKEYKIVHAFPPYLKQSPLKKVTLACCIEKSKLSRVQHDTKGDGVLSQADILITVHIPPKNGGGECEEICGKLSREIFFSSPFDIKALESGKLSYRRETDSFTVPVTVSIEKFKPGSGTSPDTPSSDTVIEAGGEAAANARLCGIHTFRDGKLTASEREDESFGAALGVINYQIELAEVVMLTGQENFRSLKDFETVVKQNGKKAIYVGCEWVRTEESCSGKDYVIKKAVLLARGCVYEEGED